MAKNFAVAALEATLQREVEYLEALEVEVAKMPEWKKGTTWHTDRVREIEATKRIIERRKK